MARPVRQRDTYTADRGRLARLEEAIEKDVRIVPETKAEVLNHLREAGVLLLEIDKALELPQDLSRTRKKGKS